MTQEDILNTDGSWFEPDPTHPMGGRNSARKIRNTNGEEAFLKTPPVHVLGNEVLAYVLADRLALPCAITRFATLFEATGNPQKGIISLRVKGFEPVEWPLVPTEIKSKPKRYIMNNTDMAKIAVFDIWSYNIDRNTGNLIICRKEEWGKKFLIYMIDNEECFYGFAEPFNRHEQDGKWENADNFIQIPELKDSIKFSEIKEFIEEIEGITDDELTALIGLIPAEYYNPIQARNVFDLLQKRRNALKSIIESWCQTNNKL